MGVFTPAPSTGIASAKTWDISIDVTVLPPRNTWVSVGFRAVGAQRGPPGQGGQGTEGGKPWKAAGGLSQGVGESLGQERP